MTELARTVAERVEPGRLVHLVLENDENQADLLRSGFRAQWNDDAHHALHVLTTGQRDGYYSDFAERTVERVARTLTSGFAYQGEPSAFRGGHVRGQSSIDLELGSFVNFIQNHDQIGNRPFGDRIGKLAKPEALRAALALLLLAPSPPMLFMGEEWDTSTPFLFFCDFEPELARLVTEGRRGEFASFAEFSDPAARERIPDPAAIATFEASKLRWDEREAPKHRAWLDFYRGLLAIRKREIAPRTAGVRGEAASFDATGDESLRAHWVLNDGTMLVLAANLGPGEGAPFPTLGAHARVLFATHDRAAHAQAAPWSVRWSIA
jgi:malto-oligosyltrehalose trehalohydrolase